jgi:hypothetical protein
MQVAFVAAAAAAVGYLCIYVGVICLGLLFAFSLCLLLFSIQCPPHPGLFLLPVGGLEEIRGRMLTTYA